MAFELTQVTKHGLIYIIFSYVETKKRLYVLGLLHHTNLHVDVCVIEEMSKLRSNGEWEFLIPKLFKVTMRFTFDYPKPQH
jgi:hypothetical protein